MVDREDTVFTYTLSSRKGMVQQCLRSIATLKQHVDSSQIKIFYTPPYDEEDEQVLEATGAEIIKKENQTEAFNVSRSLPESHYGEKINLCNIDSENVVFLDCDTVVGNNIWEVLEGDFEFKARPEEPPEEEVWKPLFEKFDEPYRDWMPNAGFLIFKNRFHQDLDEKWLKYFQEVDIQRGKVNHREQYALALATASGKVEKMTKKEHTLEWLEEKTPDAYVYHIEQAAGSSMVNVAKNYIAKLKFYD